MEFRPCIDIHKGKIKQIAGHSLKDTEKSVQEHLVSEQDGAFFGKFYQKDQVKGGHIMLHDQKESEDYKRTKEQAVLALKTWPEGFQVGGGITAENAWEFLDAGASHCIVDSYIFHQGQINYENLERLQKEIGKDHLVIDLRIRKKDGAYYVVTDQDQKFTKEKLGEPLLEELAAFCKEFLIHVADKQDKVSGIDVELIRMLERSRMNPITYGGGIVAMEDLDLIKNYGRDRIHVTIGKELDLFGGTLSYRKVLKKIYEQ